MARPLHTRLSAQRANRLWNDLTVSEARLWTYLRRPKTGARFRRQVPIGHWIADFASFNPMLVIEVDDKSHDYRDERRRRAEIEEAINELR